MARTHKARRTLTSNTAPKVQGKGRNYVPFIPGSGQQGKGYVNQLIMRLPSKYNISFKRDPRFPVLDDTGHEVATPVDHQTNATRRGGDRVKINHGAGTPQRKLL